MDLHKYTQKGTQTHTERDVQKILAIFLCCSVFASVSFRVSKIQAAPGVPKILNYQGRLLSATGTLLGGSSGASYCFKFSLYDAASSGSKVWPSGNPATSTITVTNGVFNAGVGDTAIGGSALDYDFQGTSTVFLEVQVGARGGDGTCASGGDETMETLSPRQQVFSAGFAINSDTVDGFHAVERATSTQVPVLSNGELILGSSTPSVSATGTNALTFQNRSSGNINFFSSATATLTTAGTLTIAGILQSAASGNSYFSGNLGIGTTTPATLFTVATTTNIFNVLSTGNVGIGTASPGAKLEISGGNLKMGSNYIGFTGVVGDDTTTGVYWSTVGGGQDYAIYRTSGAWTASTYQQLKLDWPTGIILDPGTGDNAGYDKSYVEITGGKGLRVTQGNVGIGTTSPGAKLDVAGTASSTGLVVNGIATTTNLNITSFTNGSILFATSSGLISQDNANFFWDDTNNRLGIGTTTPATTLGVYGTSTFMNGSVGIRTTSPLSALNVAGTTGISWVGNGSSYGLDTIGTGGTTGGSLWVNTAGRDSSWNAGFGVDGTYADFGGGSGESTIRLSAYGGRHAIFSSNMTFSTTNGDTASNQATEQMRIDKNGNVSIGTTTISQKLSVNTTSEGNVLRIADGTNTCDMDPDATVVDTCTSDESLKKNIVDAPSALSEITKYKIRSYDWKASNEHEKYSVVAQEVQAVRPDKVKDMIKVVTTTSTDADGNIIRIDTKVPSGLLGVESPNPWEVVKAIQELKTKTDALATGVCDLSKGNLCVDVAENFPTAEKVSAGDIVMIDQGFSKTTSTQFAIKKATQKTPKTPPLGIISTNPAILIEGYKTSFDGKELEGEYGPGTDAPVALVGRVPVKVSIENGEVEQGDPLTVSSIPGVAAKATVPGWIIGIALESTENSSNEEIIVFVNPTWYGGETQINTEQTAITQIDTEDPYWFGKIKSAVTSIFESFGMFIQNGIARIERLTSTYMEVTTANIEEANIGTANIQRLRVEEGIQFTDKSTGDPYCTWIENGEWVRQKGACGNTQENTESVTSPKEAIAIEEAAIVEEESQNTTTSTVETISEATSTPPAENAETTVPETETNNQVEI